ncbi:MAG: hypothetical protein EOL95_07870 [Bacteroidia bacterium]|nr:hypothetical protein [Bacteroidia bacterium]
MIMKSIASPIIILLSLAILSSCHDQPTPSSQKIYINSEYGNLKEVIVGLSSGKNPSIDAPWYKEAIKILPEDERKIAETTAGFNWTDVKYNENGEYDPAGTISETDLLEIENNDLIGVFHSLGVTVHRPDLITEQWVIDNYGEAALINGYSQDFPRDNLAIIGNNVIELTLKTPLRRFDIIGFNQLLMTKCDETVVWVSMPQIPLLPVPSDETPALEGGDVMVLGKTILVGNTANKAVGSNEAGYNWLKNYLGDDYNVIRVPLVENILHLDCALSIPKEGLAIICKDAFSDGIPEVLNGWDLVEVSLEEASRLAVNGLPVNDKNYIMSYNNHTIETSNRIKSALESYGITVHKVFFGTHNGQGGSIRCSTQAILRDK